MRIKEQETPLTLHEHDDDDDDDDDKSNLCPFLTIMEVHQVESYQIKHVRDLQSLWLMFESLIGRIIERKSLLGDVGREFLGSLNEYKLLKNDFKGKFKGPASFARNI